MTTTPPPSPAARGAAAGEPSRQQVLEWAACGLVTAAARFVPVPVLDDVIRERAARIAVSRTLTAHGRRWSPDLVEPLFDPDERGPRRRLARLTALPRKIALFPVRKYVALVGSVRGGPADVLGVVLLGRAVHRSLAAGRFAGEDPDRLREEARAVRRAYEEARKGVDLRLVGGALSAGLSGVKELTGAAIALARRVVRRGDATTEGDVPAPVREGAGRVADVLDRPEIAAQLARFDARFDERLARSR